ncbi:MAG: ABC transporter permease [Chthoniobacter sp.]|nr:ABC transporter permease [Chthoniobacter sp.]
MIRAFSRLILVSLRRHKVRATISVAGIGFGVAAMLTIVSIVLGAIGMFQSILANESQYVVFEKDVSDLFFSSVTMDQIHQLRALPMVKRVDPMLVGIVSSPDHPIVTCFGLEATDPRIVKARWLSGDAARFGTETGTIYLGRRAAEFLKASTGQTIPIGKGGFRVAGVFQTENGFEDGGVFMPLAHAQAFFHREGLASVATIKLRNADDGKALKAAVSADLQGLVALENREFNQSYSQFRILNFTSWAVGICSFFLGGMGVANTMLMSVFTRIREIAILRVCGFSKRQVAALIFGEAAVVAGVGTAAGFSIGLLALKTMNAMPQFQGYVQAMIRPDIVGAIIVISFATAFAGSLYPAYFASTIQPADALRFE